jgi:hypothetical protein
MSNERVNELASGGLMTIKEAMEFLKMGRTKLFYMLERKEIVSIWVGSRKMVVRKSIEEYVAKKIEEEVGETVAE